jgi:hypothetical protein
VFELLTPESVMNQKERLEVLKGSKLHPTSIAMVLVFLDNKNARKTMEKLASFTPGQISGSIIVARVRLGK